MHTVQEIRAEYRRLDKIVGISTEKVELSVSKRAKKRLGCFQTPQLLKGIPAKIIIAELVMESDELFMETIRHEYAHAAVYYLDPLKNHGHDKTWKKMCKLVGCSGKATIKLEGDTKQQMKTEAKYIVRCKGCGNETSYLRRGKVVDTIMSGRGRTLRCAKCGGSGFELWTRD